MKQRLLLTLALLCAVPALSIAAGATVPMKHGMPDGQHRMLQDLKAPLKDGDRFAVTQRFRAEQLIAANLSGEKLERITGKPLLGGLKGMSAVGLESFCVGVPTVAVRPISNIHRARFGASKPTLI